MTDLVMTGATADELWPLVRDYHYSRRMPSAVIYGFAARHYGGLFGDTGEPQAGVIYGQPVSRRFNIEALELSRLVRKPGCGLILSEFVAWSLRWLRANTTRPFVLSYADSGEMHHGGIYQSLGFKYLGERGIPFNNLAGFKTPQGAFVHSRTASARHGTFNRQTLCELNPTWEPVEAEPKHLYIFPLRQKWPTIARRHGWQSLPYPKPNAACPLDAPVPPGESGARPPEAAPNHREAA